MILVGTTPTKALVEVAEEQTVYQEREDEVSVTTVVISGLDCTCALYEAEILAFAMVHLDVAQS
jgi:hypothetical protein